jgi:mono/diheme cytochrome c family protein
MAEVVRHSLQHLTDADIGAMSVYLQSLPPVPADAAPSGKGAADRPENQAVLARGAEIYEKQCVACHQADGKGKPPHIPALAGNRAVTGDNLANPLYAILHGGYPPSTEGNPRPVGMPPFAAELNDQDVAAVLSHIRNTWGNAAPLVSSAAVSRYRSVPLD